MVYTLGYKMVLIFETNIEKTGECVGTGFGITLIYETELLWLVVKRYVESPSLKKGRNSRWKIANI